MEGKKKHRGNRGNPSRRNNGGPRPKGNDHRSRGRYHSGNNQFEPNLPPEEITPFALFCAFHLGIDRDGGFRPQNHGAVARRFGLTPPQLAAKLVELGLDHETIKKSGFDLQMAKYDIKVAPIGISRLELAKPWFEELREAVGPLPESVAPPVADEPVAPEPVAAPDVEIKSPIFDD